MVLPVIIMQAVTIYIFFERHLDNVSRHARHAFVNEIAFLAYLATHEQDRREALTYLFEHQTAIKANFMPEKTLNKHSAIDTFPELTYELKQRIDLPLRVSRTDKDIRVDIELADGVLSLATTTKRIENKTVDIFVLWVSGAGILLTIIALIFLRNQIRPIRELAEVAERFGKGQERSDFKPSGALEVRRAGRAFMVMRERITRQVQTRTDMLAGISHDLRTPLTRMKLELALIKDKELAKGLQQDVEQMEHMINEYLDFTMAAQTEETFATDIAVLTEELKADYARSKHKLELDIPDNLVMNVRTIAFKRLLTNLIDNAFRHAKRCKISARHISPSIIEIAVEDNGPGIPADRREEMLRPFTKLDTARNLNTSGVGLGLSVAQDIATNHGGSLELGESKLGGLKVIVRVPV